MAEQTTDAGTSASRRRDAGQVKEAAEKACLGRGASEDEAAGGADSAVEREVGWPPRAVELRL